jgi:hypothetical protein
MAEQSDDARLVAAVERATAEQLAPGAVEARVGRKATLRQWRDAEGQRIRRVDLAPDPEAGQRALALSTARDVVYWVRGLNDAHGNARVVGILWSAEGHAEVFFAVILLPA